MSSEDGEDPAIELRRERARLRVLLRDPVKNAEQIKLCESSMRGLSAWLEDCRPGKVVSLGSYDFLGLRTVLPQLGCNSAFAERERDPKLNELLDAVAGLGAELPDLPNERAPHWLDDKYWGFGSTERTKPHKLTWSRQLHALAVAKVREHITAERVGSAMLGLWNVAANFAALSAQMAVLDGAGRGKKKLEKERQEAAKAYGRQSHGGTKSKLGVEVLAEWRRRRDAGEEWDAVLDNIVKRPGMPSRKTIATRWLKGENPNKPGPRKKKPKTT